MKPLVFLPPKTGTYEEPNPPNLPLVNEKMEVTICVSPEAGWSELEAFLGETTSTLTVAMYQFTAPHIFEAIEAAVTPAGRKFELILHPVPEKPAKTGVKADDLDEEEDVIPPLEKKMKKRFEQTWATLVSKKNPDGLFASAYHIKVAVRDGNAFWLSSGNWQSSNQPDVHPFVDHPEKLPAGIPAAIQSRLSRHHQRTRSWPRSTSSTSSAISSSPPRRPASRELRRARSFRARGGRSARRLRRSRRNCSSRCG